jgi:hypothetical protein
MAVDARRGEREDAMSRDDLDEVNVPEVPEPDEPEEGVIDPADDYTEGHG